ncbi:unnamed protein product [Amoebophrya sp. A25]|nr:unnamed protein product [Amoebophrya sp. A25]|eukprot:GSA25T00012387001.1
MLSTSVLCSCWRVVTSRTLKNMFDQESHDTYNDVGYCYTTFTYVDPLLVVVLLLSSTSTGLGPLSQAPNINEHSSMHNNKCHELSLYFNDDEIGTFWLIDTQHSDH